MKIYKKNLRQKYLYGVLALAGLLLAGASSPIKTDVVKAVSDVCKKYGLQFAVYYSLWDRHAPSYKNPDPQVYVNYMLAQLKELFTNYGTICEWWLEDGIANLNIGGLNRCMNWRKKNPLCAVSVNHTIVKEEGKRAYALPSSMTKNNQFYFQYFPV